MLVGTPCFAASGSYELSGIGSVVDTSKIDGYCGLFDALFEVEKALLKEGISQERRDALLVAKETVTEGLNPNEIQKFGFQASISVTKAGEFLLNKKAHQISLFDASIYQTVIAGEIEDLFSGMESGYLEVGTYSVRGTLPSLCKYSEENLNSGQTIDRLIKEYLLPATGN